MNEKRVPTLAELLGRDDEPQPEHKTKRIMPARPAFKPAATFEEALAMLTPTRAEFVRHVLAGATQSESYRRTHPTVKAGTCQRNGSAMAQRQDVAHALSLGRKAGALKDIAGIVYDISTAHQEICERIEAAHKDGQHNAIASLLKLKLALHKLDQPAAQVQAGVQIILQTADGTVVRSFGTAPPMATEVPEIEIADEDSQ